ncbi:hypothetical protein BX285_1534 [Streptomyces sp. 1114.5]|uniref:hypothetical protein n=1 Tax=unclassified Streptomyces TaxID=2593676 RepID=UPI000BCF9B63|nr:MULTISPECIES: hypothetical protein [unclassified Streptomyces]RKT17170.1 hypothetical protein BX285_1534 [Streptomyces sp. 1114.5]SOB83378.1 hypothetical protein SAMN06272789_3582 [Streptomyces sp. 1331.2]
MPITDDIKKTLSDPTPLYALAGAGDLAYEKLREVPGKVEALAADRKGAQEKATAKLQEAQSLLAEAPAKVSEAVTALPTDLKALQERAQGFALQQVGRAVELAVKAKETYDELAERGKVVVDKARPGAPAEAAGPAELPEEPTAAEPAPKKPARARKPKAASADSE